MQQPLVSIVILNWNGKSFLEECLRSVFGQDGGPFEVLLVDNGSTDGSATFVRERFPSVVVIEAGTNLGFAGGSNLGVRRAKGDLVVLLNNDTVVQPAWLAALRRAMDDPDAVLLSSRVITEGIPDRYYERNGSVNFVGHNIMRVFSRRENLFFCTGASLAFRKNVFGEPFDPEFFLYSEDVYLGLRARFMGYRPRHVDDSAVHHRGGVTSASRPRTLITMYQERNRLLNLLLFFSFWTNVRILPIFAAHAVAKVGLALVGRRYSLWGLLRAYAWPLFHWDHIRVRRRVLREERRVSEQDVVGWMTARVTNGESITGRALNALSGGYCRIVGLRTIERFPAGSR
jgi:hypothetical protein